MRQWDWLVHKENPVEPDPVNELVANSAAVVADNVFAYFMQHQDKEWSWNGMPSVRMPFPRMFVEVGLSDDFQVGCLIEERRSPVGFFADYRRYGFGIRTVSTFDRDADELESRCAHMFDVGVFASFVSAKFRHKERVVHITQSSVFLDNDYSILRPPLGQLTCEMIEALSFPEGTIPEILKLFTYPCFLAIAFMNCRNVRIDSVEPDAHLNRERRKAGLKPFLRYHIINIEPMKTILRTEGSIETEGLKKALHICRGHFATYTPEKPLFGHFSGTIWKPAHVRGTFKEGVVVSDYNVKAPAIKDPS